jgi:hypothetical protein
MLQVYHWGADWRKPWSRVCELDAEKALGIWLIYTTENVWKRIFLNVYNEYGVMAV